MTANDNFFTGHFPDRKIMPGKDTFEFFRSSFCLEERGKRERGTATTQKHPPAV